MRKYKIYMMSARNIISYAEKDSDGIFKFNLQARETEKCKVPTASHEQESNALFYQIMCHLHGDNFEFPEDVNLITDLEDVIFYIDFSGIFDRNGQQKRYAERQQKARDMFRKNGIKLDFGKGSMPYVAFERSQSMSRNARLSFIRKDFYEAVRRRIMLDMKIGECQLSKLYAYNGLMLSSGTRIDGVEIDRLHRVIVVENNKLQASANVITVEDDGSNSNMRKYHRVERHEQFTVLEYDGEGLISKEYANVVDKKLCGKSVHTSFQIRMPYVKGMLHKVDFKDLLISAGFEHIIDIWGEKHPISDVDVILTESMFKGKGWLSDSKMTWQDYWDKFRKYKHALYITNVSKQYPEKFTELNYQFLNTLSVRAEEFRPSDLPLSWEHSPEEDNRNWLTKQTELEYYNLCANEEYRRQYFLKEKEKGFWKKKTKANYLADILEINPLFINESIYSKELEDRAESILKDYSLGTLLVAGDSRYLSADLLRLLSIIPMTRKSKLTESEKKFYATLMSDRFSDQSFYAPKAAYEADTLCTLLRNPHIARNEEIILKLMKDIKKMRHHYLGHLSDVVMVDSEMYAAERLGGADYDGDTIKTIADPIVNICVQRNYEFEGSFEDRNNMPFLKIPSAEPLLSDANDWEARFETVKNTFSSRVGQISNAAFDRSVIAYNENSTSEERQKCREEAETLAILTGLEIDSAKTGIKPDLSEYLGKSKRQRSIFLTYKRLLENVSKGVTDAKSKLNKFFENTNWDEIDSNVEKLPYYAKMLKDGIPKIKAATIPDNKLFNFATEDGWKDKLNTDILDVVSTLISEYDEVLRRIRVSRADIQTKKRYKDIDRILFSQGKDEDFDADVLYAEFSKISDEHLQKIHEAMIEQNWHRMIKEDRGAFLSEWLPELTEYFDILSDFTFSGYRILNDLILDIREANSVESSRQLYRDGDTENMVVMTDAYVNKLASDSYREAVAKKCRELLEKIIKPVDAVKYAVALGKRGFMWDVLIDCVSKNALKVRRDDL